MVPALRDVLEPVCAPPLLTTMPGADDVVDPVDVERAVDPDPVDVLVLVEEPAEVFADPDDVEDDPPESGSAHATP